MKLTEIVGRAVMNKDSGEVLGIVTGAYIDKSTNVTTHIGITKNERRLILPVANIINPELETEASPAPIDDYMSEYHYVEPGASIADEFGNVADTARDLVISRSARGGKIIGGKTSYGLSRIIRSAGRRIVLRLPGATVSRIEEQIINDFSFLIGRKMSRDIFDLGGQLFAGKGEQVNATLIDEARRLGKLVDLALSAK